MQLKIKYKKEEKDLRNKCNSSEKENIYLQEKINDLQQSCKKFHEKFEENNQNIEILNSNIFKIENENSLLKWDRHVAEKRL